MVERFRCAVASLERAEDPSGTASTVRRWFLVEQPGSWGRDAVRESALPSEVASALLARARRAGVRMLVIRRRVAQTPRRAYTAFSGPGEAWLESHDVANPEALLDIDLESLRSGGSTGGERRDEPITLTCTNGRHDACCAEFGRPTAVALETLLGHRAWEVSHIGGDRFAPNVLVLPQGQYYGRVGLAHAPDLARAVTNGRVWLPGYRGRSIHPFRVQAAEAALRRARRVDGTDAVRVTGWHEEDGSALLRVQLTAEGRHWRVDVETTPQEQAWALTCQAPRPASPPVHRIARLEPVSQDDGPS